MSGDVNAAAETIRREIAGHAAANERRDHSEQTTLAIPGRIAAALLAERDALVAEVESLRERDKVRGAWVESYRAAETRAYQERDETLQEAEQLRAERDAARMEADMNAREHLRVHELEDVIAALRVEKQQLEKMSERSKAGSKLRGKWLDESRDREQRLQEALRRIAEWDKPDNTDIKPPSVIARAALAADPPPQETPR